MPDQDALSTEITTIETTLRDRPSEYWGSDMPTRYVELIRSRESGRPAPATGRSVARIAEIEKAIRTTPGKYYGDEAMQAEYRDLLAGRDGAVESVAAQPERASGDWRATPTEAHKNMPAAAAKEWDRGGDFETRLRTAQDAIGAIMSTVAGRDKSAALDMEATFLTLPEGTRAAVLNEISMPGWGIIAPATRQALQRFGGTPEGKACLDAWGPRAPRKAAIVTARIDRLWQAMKGPDREAFRKWFDSVTPDEAIAIYWRLAG